MATTTRTVNGTTYHQDPADHGMWYTDPADFGREGVAIATLEADDLTRDRAELAAQIAAIETGSDRGEDMDPEAALTEMRTELAQLDSWMELLQQLAD